MTKKSYIFAGSSSKIAIEAALLLKQQNHKIIGISTKKENNFFDDFYSIEKYDFNKFPNIDRTIDGLVYFPGTINLKPFHRLNYKEVLNDYQLNCLGAVSFIQNYLPNLKASSSAAIVLISTVAVAVGMPYHASVSMAKGALEGLSKALAAELAPAIRVNCVAPSLTDTPLGEKFLNTPEKLEASQKRNPLKKIGEASEIANVIEFLLSTKASWITGQTIAVDGGMNNLKIF